MEAVRVNNSFKVIFTKTDLPICAPSAGSAINFTSCRTECTITDQSIVKERADSSVLKQNLPPEKTVETVELQYAATYLKLWSEEGETHFKLQQVWNKHYNVKK